MLKITAQTATDGIPTLKVEGRLAGPSVSELRSAAATLLPDARPVRLDLSGLTYADASGAALLRELVHNGTVLDGSYFVAELLAGGSR